MFHLVGLEKILLAFDSFFNVSVMFNSPSARARDDFESIVECADGVRFMLACFVFIFRYHHSAQFYGKSDGHGGLEAEDGLGDVQ